MQILFVALLCLLLPAPEAHCRLSTKDGLRFLTIDIQPKTVAPNKTVKVVVVYELKGIDDDGLKVTERKSLKFDGNEIALLEKKQVRRTDGKWIIETTFLIPASAVVGEYEILQVVFSNYFSRSITTVFNVQEQPQMVAKRLERASEYTRQLKNEADVDLQRDNNADQEKKTATASAAPKKEIESKVPIDVKPISSEPPQPVAEESDKEALEAESEQLAESGKVEEEKVIQPKDGQKKKKEIVELIQPVQEAEPTGHEQVSQDSQEQVVERQIEEPPVAQQKDKAEKSEEQVARKQPEKPEPSLSDEPQTPESQTVETVEQKVEEVGSVQPKEIAVSAEEDLLEKEQAKTTDEAQPVDTQEKKVAESMPAVEPTPAAPETTSEQPAQQPSQQQPVIAAPKTEQHKSAPVTDLNIQNTVTIDDRAISRDDKPAQTKEDNMRLLKDAQEEIRVTRPGDTSAAVKPIESSPERDDLTPEKAVDPDIVFADNVQPEGEEKEDIEVTGTAPAPEVARENQPTEDQALLQPKEAEGIIPKAAETINQPIPPETAVDQAEQVQINQLDQEKLAEQSGAQDETAQQEELLWLHNRDKIDPRVPERARREKFKGGGYGPWMLPFPLGSFSMGGERYNEKPVHSVNIEQEFSIMIHEVTIGMYQEYMKSKHGDNIQLHEPWAEELPVTNISWRDAASFAIWLSQKSGTTYRLPTEAEWEYVAKKCNKVEQTSPLLYQTDIGENQDEPERAETVYNAESDLCKIYGLKGNVWEWAQDCWSERYTEAHNYQKAYSYPKCGNRVVRGGSYVEEKEKRSSTVRMGIDQKTKVPYIGFRLVRTGVL